MFIKRLAVTLLLAAGLSVLAFNAQALGQAAEESHLSHQNHSDNLLILLQHKIALQKLQQKPKSGFSLNTLAQQGRHLRKVMPVLKRYMATPKSYYLTSDMYHDSLENRAAMLADFSDILIQYQKQLVSPR